MRLITSSVYKEGISWGSAVSLYRDQLGYYVDFLLQCNCTAGILEKVEADVKHQSVPDEFKLRFMVRALMRRVIQHLSEHVQSADGSGGELAKAPAPGKSLPAMERLVYCMRDILEYPTRDVSLLIGITDAQVQKLLSYARRRLDMYEGPSSIDIEDANGTYCRWKFVDLYRRCRRTQ